MIPLLAAEPTPSTGSTPSAHVQKLCRECYAGKGGLSKALTSIGLSVDVPMEAYPEKGKYIRDLDLSQPHVLLGLKRRIRRREYSYIHFGLPCKT